MLPYFTLQTLRIGDVSLTPFTCLLAIAALTGFAVALRHALERGIRREQIAQLSVWMVAAGAVGSVTFKLFYLPSVIVAAAQEPTVWLQYYGISSFGGLFGGCLALVLFFHRKRLAWPVRLAILDALGFAMPFAWAIGRSGCALVHDHPGMRSTSFLAVAFPSGPRFDLAVLEVLFHVLLAACFLVLLRAARPAGFYFVTFFCTYGTFRLLLDRLHVLPPRYFGVTVDTYAATLAIVIGLSVLAAMMHQQAAIPNSGKSLCKRAFSTL
jgi:phosphatidylglycerol:prolipoprotein diacylglycerol transferase